MEARASTLSSRRWVGATRAKARDFIGYEEDEDVWVAPESLRPIKRVQYAVGTEVEVLWKRRWYPATILQAKGGTHLIHYTDYESKWDEWVPSKRIRHPNS